MDAKEYGLTTGMLVYAATCSTETLPLNGTRIDVEAAIELTEYTPIMTTRDGIRLVNTHYDNEADQFHYVCVLDFPNLWMTPEEAKREAVEIAREMHLREVKSHEDRAFVLGQWLTITFG